MIRRTFIIIFAVLTCTHLVCVVVGVDPVVRIFNIVSTGFWLSLAVVAWPK